MKKSEQQIADALADRLIARFTGGGGRHFAILFIHFMESDLALHSKKPTNRRQMKTWNHFRAIGATFLLQEILRYSETPENTKELFWRWFKITAVRET